MKASQKLYSQRSDTEKLESNWKKTVGLFERKEYSMAVIRAATCAEIAANILIRAELIQTQKLEPDFVDSLLRWANGLNGKFSRIILPFFKGTSQYAKFKKHDHAIKKLNKFRNEIAHGGRFASMKHAKELVRATHGICVDLTSNCSPSPMLREF